MPEKRGTRGKLAALIAAGALLTPFAADAWMGLSAERTRVRSRAVLAGLTGGPGDMRLESEVVSGLRGSGRDAIPSVVSYVIRPRWGAPSASTGWRVAFLPLVGAANRTSVHLCDDETWRPAYQSDEHGFDNPAGLWSRDSITLLLIGDSFTHGYCTSPDSTYAANLRRQWPHTLNLGAGGAGPLAELAALREYGAAKKPRIVVWQYYENDLADLAAERQHPVLAKYLQPGFTQGLRSMQPAVDAALTEWIDRVYAAGQQVNPVEVFSWRQVARLTHLRARLRRGSELPEAPAWREELAPMTTILRSARDMVEGWGGEFIMVYVPSWSRYFDPAWQDDGSRGAVLSLAADLRIPVIDLDPLLTNAGPAEELFSRRGQAWGHFSAQGQALMAEAVAARIAGGPAQ